jgi:two-component system nitrogen regulation response regulator GlnG
MPKILVVDDEQAICWGIERLGNSLGHQVFVASSAEQGLRLAAECQPDLLILDVRLPGVDGLTAMSEFRRVLGAAPIVVITAFGDLSTAVKAVQNGAFEYVLKPFDLQEIRSTIRRALLSAQSSPVAEQLELGDGLLGKTPQMQEVFKRIALAAAADAAVLLEGECGVGKATAARAIHRHSARADKPFVNVNLSAHDAVQAEQELFGLTAGSSSNSIRSQQGLLRAAQGGTLFIEDVGELPAVVQIKLMQVLETRELPEIESEKPHKLDVRVISAATGRLIDRVRQSEFRLDLFHKLSEFEIFLPALRDRLADIPLLARHFASQRRGTIVSFAEETITELMNRPWHGNVRELGNAIEHALVIARAGLILKEHLPPPLPEFVSDSDSADLATSLTDLAKRRATDLLADPQAEGFVYEKFLEEIEPALLESAMNQFAHECAPAARALGLHRTTLKRKLDQYKLSK